MSDSEIVIGVLDPLGPDKLRNYLQMLLQRMEPDREFKNGTRH